MRSSQKLNPSLDKQIRSSFAQALINISKTDIAHQFLSDFFTEAEADIFSKRLAIAYWLKKGRSYTNIKQNLKVSSATIAKVQEMMKAPGFGQILKDLEADEWATAWSARIQKFVRK